MKRFVLDEVHVLTPTVPSKMPALWNNYRALADEKGLEYPETPLYLFKATSSFLATGEVIMHPASVTEDVFLRGGARDCHRTNRKRSLFG